MSVETQIRKIISDAANGVDGDAVPAESSLIDAGLDSLDIATVILEVQEAFGVTVPEGQEDELDSIAKLVAFVESAQT